MTLSRHRLPPLPLPFDWYTEHGRNLLAVQPVKNIRGNSSCGYGLPSVRGGLSSTRSLLLTAEHIAQEVHRRTGIPIDQLLQDNP